MKTYIINEDLIALLKKEQQTIIYEVKRVRVVDSNYSKIIKNNCLFYGCSLEGRKKYVKKMLKIKYRVPIIINKKIILVPLESMRKSECLFINPAKIIDYCHNKNNLEIRCINNNVFTLNISKYCFEKLLLNYLRLNNILQNNS